ncbi:MAG: aspartyl protease [Dehalococcoidia bacterium]|nr:aspartyl protease [Dehalococcoidia bacterium]
MAEIEQKAERWVILPGTTIGGNVGVFDVEFTVGSADGDSFARLIGVVDTGALNTVIPERVLDGLGIARDESEIFTLADGSNVEVDLGLALIWIEDRSRAVHVAFGSDPELALIGAMTLERFGVAADPVHRRLVPARITM